MGTELPATTHTDHAVGGVLGLTRLKTFKTDDHDRRCLVYFELFIGLYELLALGTEPHVVLIELLRLLELGHARIQIDVLIISIVGVLVSLREVLDIGKEEEVLLVHIQRFKPVHIQNHLLLSTQLLLIFEETVLGSLINLFEHVGHCNLL